MVGRKQLILKIITAGLAVFYLLGGTIVFPVGAEYREYIIEERDRRPVRGSFEYYDIYPEVADSLPFRGDRLELRDEFRTREISLARDPDYLASASREEDYKEVITGEPESESYFSREYIYTALGFVLLVIIIG